MSKKSNIHPMVIFLGPAIIILIIGFFIFDPGRSIDQQNDWTAFSVCFLILYLIGWGIYGLAGSNVSSPSKNNTENACNENDAEEEDKETPEGFKAFSPQKIPDLEYRPQSLPNIKESLPSLNFNGDRKLLK